MVKEQNREVHHVVWTNIIFFLSLNLRDKRNTHSTNSAVYSKTCGMPLKEHHSSVAVNPADGVDRNMVWIINAKIVVFLRGEVSLKHICVLIFEKR